MKWKVESINGIDNLVRTEDQSLVTVRPKYYLGSSGSVWASELLRIYYKEPGFLKLMMDLVNCQRMQNRLLFKFMTA